MMMKQLSISEIDEIIVERFLDTCKIITEENLDYHEFQFCESSILSTLQYLKSKWKQKNES